jgi:HlyD family secretion protein
MDRLIPKKKWPPKKIIQISMVALFVLSIIWFTVFGDHSSKLNVQDEKITISLVTKGLFQEYIPVTGNVIPIQTIYLDAIEGGRVDTLYLEAGTFVKKGDKILRLTNTDLLLDIMYREAELFQQSNNLRNTRLAMEQSRLSLLGQLAELEYQNKIGKRLFDRKSELYQKNLISQEEFELARDEYDYLARKEELTLESQKQDSLFRLIQIQQLEESLERMQANLRLVKQNVENLTLRAPITGQLTSLNAEIGESKSRGQRLGQIDVLEGFKIRVGIDEHYISRIQPGQTGDFKLADHDYHLVIKKIYPEVLEGRFEVDMYFDEKEPEGIRRGQTLHIRLQLGDLSEAVLLPTGGFFQKTGGQWVYIVEASGKTAIKRKIKLGRQNTEAYEVLDGLAPGDKVVTSSYDNFGDMDKLIFN